MASAFDVLVIGGGVQGLATCYQLSKKKELKIGLLEQFQIGHRFGSSHGASRILRSIYPNPAYIQLMQRASKQAWPELEEAAGKQLIYPTSGICFGRGATFESYTQAAPKAGLDVKVLDQSAARSLFPQFRFDQCSTVIQDCTAALIAAQDTVDSLARIVMHRGVAIHENTEVQAIESDPDPIHIVSNKGIFSAKKLVITAGPWIGKLVPRVNLLLNPIRQTVGYFQLEGERESYQLGKFPVWSFIGEEEVFYGLPEFGRKGIKIAQHLTCGTGDDPRLPITEGSSEQLEILEQFIQEQFTQPIEQRTGNETCFYTNTESEDFILDLLPQDQRIAIGSACSGHGFKFAPLTGLILAELITQGKTNIAEYENSRDLFSLPI